MAALTSSRHYSKITELNLEVFNDKKCQMEIASKYLEESENKIYIDISLESSSRVYFLLKLLKK